MSCFNTELEKKLSYCSHTYSLSVNGMDSKEQGGDKSQPAVLENSFVTSVHQQQRHQAVQGYIHGMEVEGVHASQQDIQPTRKENGGIGLEVKFEGKQHDAQCALTSIANGIHERVF